MRRALTALFLVALVSAPLRAELKYTMRMEMKKSDTAAAPVNPMLGMMGEQMMKQMLPNGSSEMVYTIGEKGTRIEFTQPAMGQAAGAVNIAKPDGTLYVLDPQNKTYWKTTTDAASAQMKAAGLAPEVTAKKTGQTETVAGVTCDVVAFDWKMALPIPEQARATLPPDFPTSLTLTGDSCTTAQYSKYADMVARGAAGMLAAMGFDKVAQGGLIVRQTMQMMGYEMKSVVTKISEETVDQTLFDVPADFKEVPGPTGMSR
jgi:Domain of unknown function (DUF4412)